MEKKWTFKLWLAGMLLAFILVGANLYALATHQWVLGIVLSVGTFACMYVYTYLPNLPNDY